MPEVQSVSLPQLAPHATAREEAARQPAGSEGPLLKPEGRVLATLEVDGRRRWIRPRPSKGAWWRRRLVVAWILIAVYTVVPWTRWDGMPTVLLDLVERRLVFFGAVFRPTETLLFGLVFLSAFVAIFLLTALFGRVWCGWACPQTVYMEFVYRPLERFFLGKAALDPKAGVSPWRRFAMYVAWLVVSAHLANTLLAWFVGADRLSEWIFRSSPVAHPVAFAVFAATTLLMMFDFAFFREQLCSLVCPYGRLQSALLDRDSLIVGYDAKRGEPRGRKAASLRGRPAAREGGCGCDGRGGCGSGGGCGGHEGSAGHARQEGEAHACGGGRRDRGDHVGHGGERRGPESAVALEAAPARGDCVDCRMCVTTCPAGIDIRDGLQLECIHCTQCIDACDAVMTKLGRPTGLIRYSSERGLAREPRRSPRYRLVVYPILLAALVAGVAYLAATRQSAFVAVRRLQGTPYVVRAGAGGDDRVESIVRLRIDNRTRGTRTYAVRGGEGVELAREAAVEVGADASGEIDVVVLSARGDFARGRRSVDLVVEEAGRAEEPGRFREVVRTNVLGPLVLAPLGEAKEATR